MECPSANSGGGQSGSTISRTNVSRSRSYSAKLPTWPLRGSASIRSDSPWPRQSIMATAKPRLRASPTTSKYFSMNSARPGSTSTVPLRPSGGAQRAKRNATPSGVLKIPVTAPSGTGFAGVEMSVIGAAGAAGRLAG